MTEPITISEYERRALLADKRPDDGSLRFILLGLFGEVGDLLSEAKKRKRDLAAQIGYPELLPEEIGDVLWYLTIAANRIGSNLAEVCEKALPTLAENLGTPAKDWSFTELQPEIIPIKIEQSPKLLPRMMALAGATGQLVSKFGAADIEIERELLLNDLAAVFELLIAVTTEARASLEIAAFKNNAKTVDRWPAERNYPQLLDEDLDKTEQLPRSIVIEIRERKFGSNHYVYQSSQGINVGDRLTDNAAEADDYRFHDVFHYAFAAVMGWSPVLRAILRLKRKSNPHLDEVEDGARAILVEEGLVNWIFKFAQRFDFFRKAKAGTLPIRFLRQARDFTEGYEPDSYPLWLWEEAILEGCRAFLFLRDSKNPRGGYITLNLTDRCLELKNVK